MCVFFPFILDIKFVGRTSRGHTGLLVHLLSAVHALIFLARRIQTFLSLVDRKVEFCVCVWVFSSHSFWISSWTYQPGSHRRKVTQDFSSTFFLRCVPSFFSREGFSHSLPSSTVKSNFVYYHNNLIVLHPLGILFFVLVFSWEKSRLPGSNSRPNVSEGYEVPLSYRGDRLTNDLIVLHSLGIWSGFVIIAYQVCNSILLII